MRGFHYHKDLNYMVKNPEEIITSQPQSIFVATDLGSDIPPNEILPHTDINPVCIFQSIFQLNKNVPL